MYALSFDMAVDKLKEYYGKTYSKAYNKIRIIMGELGFEWTQGDLYITKSEKNILTCVYKVINKK
jgi:virulence-associated protein VapD